ncbi:MAG TPA: hypothetical protein PLO50_07805 [Nitrospira sp.]|nr:hypothetical protein [Nitrospira sp.]
MSDKDSNEEVSKLFTEELNRHGYSFQDAMVRRINSINKDNAFSTWLPWVPELPVEVQGSHTRIDFVYGNDQGFYLVFECKRPNPAVSNWCFAKTCFTSPNPLFRTVYAESILDIGMGVLRSNIEQLCQPDDLYQIALDVKSPGKGDSDSRGRGQIEDAATQVCRQLNGLVEFYYRHTALMTTPNPNGKKRVVLVPVILTTARLWTTEFDLSTANPETGKIEASDFEVRETEWLWYQYHQSPGLKHSAPTNYQPPGDIENILFYEFVRPIAIVTPKGLQTFLNRQMWNG